MLEIIKDISEYIVDWWYNFRNNDIPNIVAVLYFSFVTLFVTGILILVIAALLKYLGS